LRHWFHCCVRVLRTLPRNGSTLLLVECLLRNCLQRRSLTVGLHVTIYFIIIYLYIFMILLTPLWAAQIV
jgi:hypothetical protein